MSNDRERNRQQWPDFAEACDRFRGSIVSAFVTDADGEIVAGRCPSNEYQYVEMDAASLLQTRATLDQQYADTKPAPKSWVKRVAVINNGGLT